MITQINNHADLAVARLRQQFKGKPLIEAFLRALCVPVQAAEDMFWQLLTERSIANGAGVQLDRIGTIVGQPRNGRDDTTYKRFLSARIAANRSHATAEDVLTVARLVLNDNTVGLVLKHDGPATALLKLTVSAVPDDLADLLVTYFLRRTVADGVRLVVESSSADPETGTFLWDSADVWDGPKPWATARD